jgi:hypothetical protein
MIATPGPLAEGPLSAEQCAAFWRDGYLVLDSGIPEAVLDGAVREVAPLYPAGEPGKGIYQSVRVQDAWQKSDCVRQVATWKLHGEALRQLYGRQAKPFQTLNFPYGTGQPLHSDTIHFNSHPPGFVAGVWVAFEDVTTLDQGPLVYVPGSHRWPEITMVDVGVPAAQEHHSAYEKFVLDRALASGAQPAFGFVRKGQSVFWHGNLLHGGVAERAPDKTRHSQATHYFFDGCWYYTPMLTQYHVRKPVWIE